VPLYSLLIFFQPDKIFPFPKLKFEGIPGFAGRWQSAVGSQQFWSLKPGGLLDVLNTIKPKGESFKFKTLYLEPRTLYRHGEAVYLANLETPFS